jgi:glycosyltransferase involved in cell wall biosynthesis
MASPKKLVFLLRNIAGGGAEKVVLNLYKAMELYAGYECHIISLERVAGHAIDPDIRVHYLDDKNSMRKQGLQRYTYRNVIVKIIDDYIDEAIGKNCAVISNLMFCDKIMSLSRHRVFHLIHNSYTESLLGGKPFYRKFFLIRNYNKVYSRHPMVFCSQAALDSFCRSFTSDVAKHVIYNPVNEAEVRALADAEPAGLEYDYIVHVGRFNRQKRHDRLLKAFAKVRADVRLLLLGEGRLEADIRSLAEKLGIAGRVVFMGFRQNPYPVIKNAKALVLTSDFEGLPTVIIEAISLGVPVVATDCPSGIDEIIDRPSPVFVPLDDIDGIAAAIDDAVVHPEKYTRPLNPKFSSQFAARQYAALLEQTS